jgi:hypothetical protein
MLASVNTMQASLAKLTSARDQYRSDPYTLTAQRNDVIRLLQVNHCGNYIPAPQPVSSGGFFANLFGGGAFSPFGNGYYSGSPYGGDTYRTVCVRSCDGFYFPISYSTTSDHFAADAQTCTAMCPAGNASLYVYHNPGEEADAMVSLTGTPYSALPTAFKYRTSYDSSCTCGSPGAAGALAASGAPGVTPVTPINIPSANATFTPIPSPLAASVPLPTNRPAVSEDPETLADRGGSLAATAQNRPANTAQTVGLTADGRSVRVVGPGYFVAR